MGIFSLIIVLVISLLWAEAEAGAAKNWSARGANASIILHIGPHKTGSTYVQTQLHNLAGPLAIAGYCWNKDEQVKSQHYFAQALLRHKTTTQFDSAFMTKCLQSGHTMVLSSESFSLFHLPEHFKLLRGLFKGHQPHVIAVYREPLTILHSVYTQVQKFRPYASSFDRYITSEFENNGVAGQFFHTVFDAYAKEFGTDSMTLLDYFGMAEAKQDIVHVMLCEVAGVLCDVVIPHITETNVSPDMVPYGILHLVLDFLHGRGCVLREGFDAMTLIPMYSAIAPSVPSRRLSLEALKQLAKVVDFNVRSRYGDIMLYNNRNASMHAMEALVVMEVDDEVFMSSPVWTKWLREETGRLIKSTVAINCVL